MVISLIPTVKQFEEVITNLGNLVTVKVHMRHGRMHIVASVNNLSVCRFPVSVTFDCGNHLLFNLTHESKEKGLGLWWGDFPSTSIQYTILGSCLFCVQVIRLSHPFHLFLYGFPSFVHNIYQVRIQQVDEKISTKNDDNRSKEDTHEKVLVKDEQKLVLVTEECIVCI